MREALIHVSNVQLVDPLTGTYCQCVGPGLMPFPSLIILQTS